MFSTNVISFRINVASGLQELCPCLANYHNAILFVDLNQRLSYGAALQTSDIRDTALHSLLSTWDVSQSSNLSKSHSNPEWKLFIGIHDVKWLLTF
jgi:hypothetical protein